MVPPRYTGDSRSLLAKGADDAGKKRLSLHTLSEKHMLEQHRMERWPKLLRSNDPIPRLAMMDRFRC
jgi:hypothetical protein